MKNNYVINNIMSIIIISEVIYFYTNNTIKINIIDISIHLFQSINTIFYFYFSICKIKANE